MLLPPTRRQLLARSPAALGALASLLAEGRGVEQVPMPRAKASAKRIIYLFQSGAPSQIDLFDHKPGLKDLFAAELPDSIRKGQRLTGMTSRQESFPIAPSKYSFKQHGQSGAWVSELLPRTATVVDHLCFVKSMHTEAINHDPAITFCQTGAQLAGRPSFGAWVAYGLGSMNRDLPAFVVLLSQGSGNPADQPLYDRLWGSGFLPSSYQGVKFRSQGDPVLFLKNPDGLSDAARRRTLDDLASLNKLRQSETGDPETDTRISQYEMAFKMQSSVPDLVDLSKEDAKTFDLYGEDAKKPGTFAANCLLARRLAERDVRFIQLYHRGWDQHTNLPKQIEAQCRDSDRASAALITDLKRRGLLDDTLVIWGGEFGRTVYCQGKLTKDDYGRDHHPRCFTVWMAGGGVKPGFTFGETDDFSYNVVKDPVHVHDLNATILHCLGIDHTKLTYRYQGRDFRLTDVFGNVVKDVVS
ncbi:MAG TPA: DUF1501 domain-containing protein [Gemmata sp.]|nr:DUF1501 domain-containing protein [Gemmata sp.]